MIFSYFIFIAIIIIIVIIYNLDEHHIKSIYFCLHYKFGWACDQIKLIQ